MNSYLPDGERSGPALRAPKSSKTCINAPVFGHRDPRGPDNNIRVWVDDKDRLHIRVEICSRCYKHERIIRKPGFVEVIAR